MELPPEGIINITIGTLEKFLGHETLGLKWAKRWLENFVSAM